MNAAAAIGATLAFGVGVAHSYLGERYVLIRLMRRADLPHLFGSDWFTRRTLRFAWHLTTLSECASGRTARGTRWASSPATGTSGSGRWK